MREINLDKNRCIEGMAAFGGLSLFFVFALIKLGIYDKDVTLGKKLIGIVLVIGFLLWLIKSFTEILISFLRFYNLRIEILRDKLILRNDTKECEIPMNKDTSVVCCMDGWLISWPSKENRGIILLKRYLLGNDFLELCIYFRENTHYIPSQSIIRRSRCGLPLDPYSLDELQPDADYAAAEKEKKRLLKSLHVNVFNPLKYIRWPASCVNSNNEL